MRVHDPLCPPFNGHLPGERCQICGLIDKVRADERERSYGDAYRDGYRDTRADLRAQVEALRWFGIHDVGTVVMRDDVLALIDGDP